MTKMTPRQIKIIEKLGEALQVEVDVLSLSAAKGIIHFGMQGACDEAGIELEEAQEYDREGKIRFMSRFMDITGERIARYHVAPERVEEIKKILMQTYKNVM